MKIGYARVLTSGQNLDLQIKVGIEKVLSSWVIRSRGKFGCGALLIFRNTKCYFIRYESGSALKILSIHSLR